MEDVRVPFDKAKCTFQAFLVSQGWPDDIVWLSRDRVVGRRRTYWVFRPDELTSDDRSRAFYESVCRTSSSIRIDASGRLGRRSVAYVEDYGGPSRMLNFGVLTDPWIIRPVSSRLAWVCLRAMSWMWGGTPFLRAARITGTQASVAELGEAAAVFGTRGIRRRLA